MFKSKVCHVIKITKKFICLIFTGLVLLKDIYQPNIQLLISVAVITVDLDTLFNPKEDEVVQKDKESESKFNLTRNIILLGLLIGCILFIDTYIDGHAEPPIEVSSQLSATPDERIMMAILCVRLFCSLLT